MNALERLASRLEHYKAANPGKVNYNGNIAHLNPYKHVYCNIFSIKDGVIVKYPVLGFRLNDAPEIKENRIELFTLLEDNTINLTSEIGLYSILITNSNAKYWKVVEDYPNLDILY